MHPKVTTTSKRLSKRKETFPGGSDEAKTGRRSTSSYSSCHHILAFSSETRASPFQNHESTDHGGNCLFDHPPKHLCRWPCSLFLLSLPGISESKTILL